MEKQPHKNVQLSYDRKNNTVFIGASKKDFVPKYLDYALEYLKIPKDANRIFQEDFIPWENPEIVNDLAEELIECSTYGFKQEVCGKAAECLIYLMNKYLKQE